MPGSGVAASSSSTEPSAQGTGATPESAEPRLAAGAGHGDADERERECLAVHRLQVRARVRLGNFELEDQLAGPQGEGGAVGVGRQPVELGDRQLPLARPQPGIERDERGRRIRRMRRGAALVAEDRMLAVGARLREAALAAVEPARELQPPVPAARRLQEVAADRPHRPHLRRGGEAAGLAEGVRHLRVDLELRQGRAGADRRALDPARNDRPQLDQRLGLDEAVAEQRNELRSAGERAPGAVLQRRARFLDRARP